LGMGHCYSSPAPLPLCPFAPLSPPLPLIAQGWRGKLRAETRAPLGW
jgi:hypothetical protein